MLKAIREAKRHTNWTDPNNDYEQGAIEFVKRLLDPLASTPFLEHFKTFQRRIAYFGRLNSLAQTLLKLTSPGVPDLYQGTELWDFSLVDPDNRRPVNFERRTKLLRAIKAKWKTEQGRERLIETRDGVKAETKLLLIWRTLQFRNQHRELFENGAYLPLSAHGKGKENVCAFARTMRKQISIVVVPRLVARLGNGETRVPLGKSVWGDTRLTLPSQLEGLRLHNIFTEKSLAVEKSDKTPALPMATVLEKFPVALLSSGKFSAHH